MRKLFFTFLLSPICISQLSAQSYIVNGRINDGSENISAGAIVLALSGLAGTITTTIAKRQAEEVTTLTTTP